VVGLLAWIVIGSAAGLYPDAWNFLSRTARRVWRRDALVALVVSLAAGAGVARVNELLTTVFHAYAPIDDELFPATFSTPWPAAGYFLSIFTRTLLMAALAAVAIYIVRSGWKRWAWWLWAGLALILASLGPAHAHSLGEYFAGWSMNLLPLLVAGILVGFFFRDNILSYVVVLFCMQMAEPLVDLFTQSNKFFLHNGVALALLAAVVIAWMLWTNGRSEGTTV
jgi:hypothetical protein